MESGRWLYFSDTDYRALQDKTNYIDKCASDSFLLYICMHKKHKHNMIKEALCQFYNQTDNRTLKCQLCDSALTDLYITTSSFHEPFVGADMIETDNKYN
jgi:hypothetical protein